MSHSAKLDLLVCYDIRDKRRLGRIHRCMTRWGLPLQYSVFYCQLTSKGRRQLEQQLRELMDERQDDIRIYGIKSYEDIQFAGRQPLPTGITIYGNKALQSINAC